MTAANSPQATGPMTSVAPEVSVVIPAHNEAENLATLVPEIAASLDAVPHEIIVVDDASTDDTPAAGRAACRRRHRRAPRCDMSARSARARR